MSRITTSVAISQSILFLYGSIINKHLQNGTINFYFLNYLTYLLVFINRVDGILLYSTIGYLAIS